MQFSADANIAIGRWPYRYESYDPLGGDMGEKPSENRKVISLNEALSLAFVGLPLAHVLGASLFLCAYGKGFGGRMSNVFTAADIVTISISEMPRVYFYSILMSICLMSLGHIFLELNGLFAIFFRQQSLLLPPRPPRNIRLSASVFLSVFYVIVIFLIGKVGRLFLVEHGFEVPHLLFATIMLVLVAPAVLLNIQYLSKRYLIAALVLFFMSYATVLMGIGMDRGQDDRLYSYAKMEHFLRCVVDKPDKAERADKSTIPNEEYRIIRKLSDHYLVAFEDGGRAITDLDCKIKLRILPFKAKNLFSVFMGRLIAIYNKSDLSDLIFGLRLVFIL